MRRSSPLQKRGHPIGSLQIFSLVFGCLLATSLLGICSILPMTRLPGPRVSLPAFSDQSSTTAPKGHAIVITFTRDNKLYLNNRNITYEELPLGIKALRKDSGKAPLYLKIDRRVPYGKAVTIWQLARAQQREIVSLVLSGRDSFDQRILQVSFGKPNWFPQDWGISFYK